MSARPIDQPDIEPFEVFYRRECPRMVAVARALWRTTGAAEDVAQEPFVSAHRYWEDPGGPGSGEC